MDEFRPFGKLVGPFVGHEPFRKWTSVSTRVAATKSAVAASVSIAARRAAPTLTDVAKLRSQPVQFKREEMHAPNKIMHAPGGAFPAAASPALRDIR